MYFSERGDPQILPSSRTVWPSMAVLLTAGGSILCLAFLGVPSTTSSTNNWSHTSSSSSAIAIPVMSSTIVKPHPWSSPQRLAHKTQHIMLRSAEQEGLHAATSSTTATAPSLSSLFAGIATFVALVTVFSLRSRRLPAEVPSPNFIAIGANPWSMASSAGEIDDSLDDDDRWSYANIRWLPVFDQETEAQPGELVMPIFPLDNNASFPGTHHGLNIIEPRYCELYSDVILNGSRRFVVPLWQRPANAAMPRQPGKMGDLSIAEVGAVFYIDEFQKVDEVDSYVKYVCDHKVIGRVRIKRLLNPKSLVDRKTYVRAVVEEFTDVDQDVDSLMKELVLSGVFRDVVTLHKKLGTAEPVRFVDTSPAGNLLGRGDDGSFWQTAALWQALINERLQALQVQRSIAEQDLIVQWLKEKGLDLKDLMGKEPKVGIRLADLPADVQRQFRRLQENYQEEAKPLETKLICFSQALLQEDRHAARLDILGAVMTQELRRVQAKASLLDALGGK